MRELDDAAHELAELRRQLLTAKASIDDRRRELDRHERLAELVLGRVDELAGEIAREGRLVGTLEQKLARFAARHGVNLRQNRSGDRPDVDDAPIGTHSDQG